MRNFLELMAEILEVEASEISAETRFREDVPDWDSMKGFAILVMVEDEFDARIEVPDFLECHTIADLYRAAGQS